MITETPQTTNPPDPAGGNIIWQRRPVEGEKFFPLDERWTVTLTLHEFATFDGVRVGEEIVGIVHSVQLTNGRRGLVTEIRSANTVLGYAPADTTGNIVRLIKMQGEGFLCGSVCEKGELTLTVELLFFKSAHVALDENAQAAQSATPLYAGLEYVLHVVTVDVDALANDVS